MSQLKPTVGRLQIALLKIILKGWDDETIEFIVRAVNSHEALLDFAKKHHEVCSECEGTGKIYNNADPTSGQWVECPYLAAIEKAEGKVVRP